MSDSQSSYPTTNTAKGEVDRRKAPETPTISFPSPAKDIRGYPQLGGMRHEM